MRFEPRPDEPWITTRLDFLVNWGRANSLWPMPFGTACCAIEMMASFASKYDLARFGMERMAFSPRQSDMLICAGRVPYKLAPVLRRIWQQMPQPKWAISMGACASTGGMFDNYAVVQGIDTIIPVDVYVPGCPPRPEGLIYGIMMLQKKVLNERNATPGLRNEMTPDPTRCTCGATIRLRSTPRPLTSSSITSPCFMKRPSSLPQPPPTVPEPRTSPG